tara:strand:+ start:2648 stop:3586 length:939 start_codon:yes stop_codon:yes gene_type:complete
MRTFQDKQKKLPQVMKNSGFVQVNTLPMHTGDSKIFAERIDTTQYAGVRDEGEDAAEGVVQYGYEKTATVYTIAQTRSITKIMRDAGKDPQIIDKITSLTEICPNTIDLDLAARLTFAWSTTYTYDGATRTITVGDGLALISAVHTLTGSATTYSNQITANPAFSQGALETAEKSFVEEAYDNLGIKTYYTPTTIVTTDDPNTINEVRRLLNATANVDSSNAGTVNVYANKYKHVISGRIATTATGARDTAKSKYWFLVCADASDFYFYSLVEPYVKAPNDGNNGEEFASENWTYLAAATYLIAIVSGKWIR